VPQQELFDPTYCLAQVKHSGSSALAFVGQAGKRPSHGCRSGNRLQPARDLEWSILVRLVWSERLKQGYLRVGGDHKYSMLSIAHPFYCALSRDRCLSPLSRTTYTYWKRLMTIKTTYILSQIRPNLNHLPVSRNPLVVKQYAIIRLRKHLETPCWRRHAREPGSVVRAKLRKNFRWAMVVKAVVDLAVMRQLGLVWSLAVWASPWSRPLPHRH